MRPLWTKSAALLIVAAGALLAARPAQAQVVVVTVQSIDAAMGDIKYLLKMGGREDLGTQLEGLLGALSPEGKPFFGIDTKRPFGLYANLPKEGTQPEAVIFIPITKDTQFLELLTKFNVPAQKGEKDVYKITPPQGDQLFLRFANEHAYLAQKAEHLQGKLIVPATVIPGSHKSALIAATARLEQIPKELKQMALAQIDQQIDAEKDKKSGENDVQHQGRLAGMKMARAAAASVIEDSKEVTFSLQVDQKQNNVALDLSLVAKPGSPLAASIKSFGAGRSMFSGLAKNSALNFLFRVPVPAEFQTAIQKAFDQGVEEGLKNAKSEAERDLGRKLVAALKPTIGSDVLDAGAVLYGPTSDEKYTVVGGVQVKEGRNLEKAVLDALKHVPDNDRKNIQIDADKIGELRVHMVRPNETPNEDVKRTLGSNDVYVVAMDNAALFAIGHNAKQALKDAVAGLKSGADAATAPIQFEASVSRLAPLAKDDNAEKFRAAAKKIFTGALKDRDRVRISVQGGDTLRLRVDAHAELVKLIFELAPIP